MIPLEPMDKVLVYPSVDAQVFQTAKGTPYLTEPGVVVLAAPDVRLWGLHRFLRNLHPDFEDYLADPKPAGMGPCEELAKFMGQLCYLSLGPKRTKNAQIQEYLDHIKSEGHGSVLEHASITMLLYGIDRAVTHEVVRHRAGWGFSQISQRYVDGKLLRFVERPEYQNDMRLHGKFMDWIDRAKAEYDERAALLLELQGNSDDMLGGDSYTERRKKVNQAARGCLPNETEAIIGVTGNIRAIRHAVEVRAARAADIPTRRLACRIHQCVSQIAPVCFSDHVLVNLPDGTQAVSAGWRKV